MGLNFSYWHWTFGTFLGFCPFSWTGNVENWFFWVFFDISRPLWAYPSSFLEVFRSPNFQVELPLFSLDFWVWYHDLWQNWKWKRPKIYVKNVFSNGKTGIWHTLTHKYWKNCWQNYKILHLKNSTTFHVNYEKIGFDKSSWSF